MTWRGEIVGRLHDCNSTCADLAQICGYTPTYVSMLLNCKRNPNKSTIFRLYHGLFQLEYQNSQTRKHISGGNDNEHTNYTRTIKKKPILH